MPPSTPPSAGFANPADTWNRRFSQDGIRLWAPTPNAWLRDNAAVWPHGAHILSVADGEGRNSVWLASQGHVVDAFDIAEVGVAKARKLAGEQGVSVNFSVADCDSFAWPAQTYDGIAAIFCPVCRPRRCGHGCLPTWFAA